MYAFRGPASARCLRQGGFSLIEVVISIFIVGTIVFMSNAILLGAPLIQSAKNQDIALKIAVNEIEGLRALGYSSVPVSGPFSDTLLVSLPSGSANITVSDFNADTKKIEATVSWTERGVPESVSLSTLITKIGGLQ